MRNFGLLALERLRALREMLGIILLPMAASKIGYLEAVTLPGTCAMDVCLPIVERSCNAETVPYSLTTGMASCLFSALLGQNTLLVTVLSCQFISNVPSAILLSQFTSNYADLLVGVNIGGVGTLIASLASLITFREYVKRNPGKTGYYIRAFSLFNFSFLAILTGFMLLLKCI